VGYWAFWDGTATDHSGNGNDGTVIGGTFVENGISLDNADDFITIADDASLNIGTGDVTIYAWFYRDTAVGDDVLYSLGASDPVWYGIEFGSGRGIGPNKEATVQSNDGNYAYRSYPDRYGPPEEMPTGAWTFIAFCIDRDVGTKTWSSNYKSYSTSVGTTNSTNYVFTSGGLWNGIAVGRSTTTLFGANLFDGTIGEVLQFNAAKTDVEVTAFFNATKARYGVV